MANSRTKFNTTKEKKVFLLMYQPFMPDEKQALDLVYGYEDPEKMVEEFCSVIHESSRHAFRYVIARRETIQQPPTLVGNFIYPENHLVEVIDGKRAPREPELFDYDNILEQFNICNLVASREIDEVWVMAPPHSGLHEAIMGGPQALYLTASPLKHTENALRRFVIMGFDYSQDVGLMLESFIHRSEAILHQAYSNVRENAFASFCSIPSGVGTAHLAPNSRYSHDFKNNAYVQSYCKLWGSYPDVKDWVRSTVNHTEWGYGSRIAHHTWWLDNLPTGVGKTDGIFNNWWHYIMTPDWINAQVPVDNFQ